MADAKTYSTRELSGKRVVGGAEDKRIGKVAHFVFHPTAKRCIGFVVKRPDVALMFHRKDLFVPLDGFSVEDGDVVLVEGREFSGEAAIKRLGVNWDACVFWELMPLFSESGEHIGQVGDVLFSCKSGKVVSIEADRGAAAKALLGTTTIPADKIIGFRLGLGVELAVDGEEASEDEDYEPLRGAIVVSDAVLSRGAEGGLAEKAGRKSAIIQHKVKTTVKDTTSAAAKKTGEAVGKGAFATGRQIGRARGMFSAFKNEYKKARSGEDD